MLWTGGLQDGKANAGPCETSETGRSRAGAFTGRAREAARRRPESPRSLASGHRSRDTGGHVAGDRRRRTEAISIYLRSG